jgi:membrane protease YdiL (CAAX protease family)
MVGIIMGGIILSIMMKIYDLNLPVSTSLNTLSDKMEYQPIFKVYLAISHVLIFILCPLIFIFIFYRNQFYTYLPVHRFKILYLPLFLFALLCIYPIIGYITFFIEKIPLPAFLIEMENNSMDTLYKIIHMESPLDLLINLVLISIIPGIGEEILFRGVIQKELTQKISNPHLAIIFTALIFGLFHFQVIGLLAKTVIGVILGYAYFYSGSLLLPMLIHAINNGISVVTYYIYQPDIQDVKNADDNVPLALVILSVMSLVFVIRSIHSFYQSTIPQSYEL